MVAEGYGLRRLQMGKARHHSRSMFERAGHQRVLKRGERGVRLVDGVADIEAEIGRDLVVARAGGVQPARGGPDQLGKPALDIHVNVLERTLEIERSLADF